MMYNTVTSIYLLIPVMAFAGEHKTLMRSKITQMSSYWNLMTLTGLLGFLLNLGIFLQIKHTSPLTHNMSGTAKACVQTILSVIIFQNEITLWVTLIYNFNCY